MASAMWVVLLSLLCGAMGSIPVRTQRLNPSELSFSSLWSQRTPSWSTGGRSSNLGSGVQSTIVTTSSGPVSGVVAGNVTFFKGIPYAAPPVGNLRFQPPVPPTPWTTPFNATKYGPGCIQTCVLPALMCPETVSEDCLSLSVFTPTGASNRPVYVFAAGGAFMQGVSGCDAYDGSVLAQVGGIVVVTINYRLGAFGFLTTDVAKGNQGIQDQRLALQWVQKNIAQFGGDPTRVTFGGESAGANSVSLHMTNPKSAGLFRAVVMESNPWSLPMLTSDRALSISRKLNKALGCKKSDYSCLMKAPASSINDAANNIQLWPNPLDVSLDVFLTFAPTLDGDEFSMQLLQAFETGAVMDVPILLGSNSNEGDMFVYLALKNPFGSTLYVASLTLTFGLTNVFDILSEYPASTDPNGDNNRKVLSSLLGDFIFGCAERQFMTNFQKYHKSDIYLYSFDHPLSYDPWGERYSFCRGIVCHGSELGFVFDSANLGGYNITQQEYDLSHTMVENWSNFVNYLDPGNGWRPFESTKREYGVFAHNGTFHMKGNEYKTDKCELWDDIGYDK